MARWKKILYLAAKGKHRHLIDEFLLKIFLVKIKVYPIQLPSFYEVVTLIHLTIITTGIIIFLFVQHVLIDTCTQISNKNIIL